ncbi:hypothetical protein niasHS_001551 [Heterodera schachtii]|uniref:Ectopic P granules protein 5 n=1 Tax=Heterodera schachtii TaxID=97005 RepID=A0ABD2KDY2_HETSC
MEAVKTKKTVVLSRETRSQRVVDGPVPEAPTLADLLLLDEPCSSVSQPAPVAVTPAVLDPSPATADRDEHTSINVTDGGEIAGEKGAAEKTEKEEGKGERGKGGQEQLSLPERREDGQRQMSSSSELERTHSLSAPIASIYPSISSSVEPSVGTKNTPKISIEIESEKSNVPRLYPTIVVQEVEAAAPSRAELVDSGMDEAELLSEQQLLECYQNEQLEFVDDFVDVFVEHEIEPRNSLFELLNAYKDVCERMQNSQDKKTAAVELLETVNNEVWTVSEQRVVQHGNCGCGRNASGQSSCIVARLHPEKLVTLKDAMDKISECELEVGGFCGEVRSRSLALQIQWNVVDIGAHFFTEHQLQPNSQPMLLTTDNSSIAIKKSRKVLRGALSDLFYFFRFPLLPNRFRDSLIGWVTELASVLLKACTGDDQCFLLCHLLRCPSPIDSWGAQLMQTFIDVPSLDQRRAMDNFVALLSLLMRSVEKRDQFMLRVAKFYEGEEAWNLVSEDGDSDCSNLAELTESDLVALLSQFPIRSLLDKITDNISKIVHFFCTYWELVRNELAPSDRSLVQNEINRIVLQAVFYIVSKKSAGIRQFLVDFPFETVSECCRLRCQLLLRSPPNRQIPTVTALYAIPASELVQRVKNTGNFMDNIGGVCRESDELTYTVSTLAAIVSRSELELQHFVVEFIDICFLNETLREKFYKVGSEAMAVLIERNPPLLGAVLRYIDRHVDHLDEYAVNILSTVPLGFCTVSAEDISDRLGKWLISRSIDHPASSIARRVLSSLNWDCQSPEPSSLHKSSSVTSVDGQPQSNRLWLSVEIHDLCAETLVKAHIVQCKQRNNLIAKSVNKAARMALKCPDLEQQFDRFCWDVLLRLKISEKPNCPTPPNDLTAFYVFCVQKCLSSSNLFFEAGLPLFQELVNASCFKAAAVLLIRIVHAFPGSNQVQNFIANPTFCEVFERLLHADESAYAVQLLMGADKFPGPVLSLMSGGIIHQISIDAFHFEQRKVYAQAWVRLLTCDKRTHEWNSDKFVLYLLGCVAKCCHLFDPQGNFGMVEILRDLYKAQHQAWRDTVRGPLSWFSSSSIPPPLIAQAQFLVSPWATFMLLRAEQEVFALFNFSLSASLAKHPSRSMEEALKKACSRHRLQMPVERLPFFRWAQFCCETGGTTTSTTGRPPHLVFPLALQQFAIAIFSRIHFEGHPYCPGDRFLHCKQADKLLAELRNELLPRTEVKPNASINNGSSATTVNSEGSSVVHETQPATAPAPASELSAAIRHWLGIPKCFQPELIALSGYADLPKDYLLQMIHTGNQHIWAEFVDVERLKREQYLRMRPFDQYCHLAELHPFHPPALHPHSPQLRPNRCRFPHYANLTQLFSALQQPQQGGKTVPFPAVPVHHDLPVMCRVERNASHQILNQFDAYLSEMNKVANAFLATREFVDTQNAKYAEQFTALYKDSQKELKIMLRCGNFLGANCPRPSVTEMTLNVSEYDKEVANTMNVNRREREEQLAKLLARSNALAINSARLEHICTQLNNLSSSSVIVSNQQKALGLVQHHNPQLFHIGLKLFYRFCSSVQGDLLLFPAGMDAYEMCLRRLGTAFIARNPVEQLNLMRVVLAGNPLNHLLVDHFTPHCVQPPELLAQLYSELSASVRQTGTSLSALALLRRMDIEHAGRQLPPNQFRSLMPVMFENLASVTGTSLLASNPLRDLCMDHFVHAMFHQFPHNIVDALRLVLSGCDKQCVPPSLFVEIAKRLHVDNALNEEHHRCQMPPSGKNGIAINELNTEKARECVEVITNQLTISRREFTGRLFNIWAPYLERVCALADFFLRIFVNGIFRADASTSAMESELAKAFRNVQHCFAPLLEPVPISNLAPWGANDVHLATGVLDRFIRHLLWLPYTLYIPPGSETPEALFWQYFATRLVSDELRNGAQSSGGGLKHIYAVYENKLNSLNWARFWPTLIDMDRMDKLLTSAATAKGQNNELLAQIIADIVVRLPWAQIIHQYQEGFQPEQARREFHSLLIAIFGKCVLRREHYTRSKASMCSLLKLLHDNCHWSFTKVEAVERVGKLLADAFPSPAEWFEQQSGGLDDAQLCWQSIWRQACHFSTVSMPMPTNLPLSELDIPRKRTIYIRTQLHLLFRPSNQIAERAEQLRHYAELLDRANFILISETNKNDYLDLAKEFVSVWADYIAQQLMSGGGGGPSANKKGRAVVEAFVAKLSEWLADHPDSPLVLLLANATMEALKNAPRDIQSQFGLGLLDTCIGTFFKKNSMGQWREISQWVCVPESAVEELLFAVPRSDAPNTEPHFLTVNAHLMREMAVHGAPAKDLLKLAEKLRTLLTSIKPKYLTSSNEPAFLLCLDKWLHLCIRMFTTSSRATASAPSVVSVPPLAVSAPVPLAQAHEQFDALLCWLRRVHAEEGGKGGGGVSFLAMVTRLGRKPSFSVKLQLFTTVLHLFLVQQQLNKSQPPRLQPGQPVLNGRAGAFRDLQQHKVYSAEFGDALADVAHFFTRPAEYCLTDAPELFRRLAHHFYPGEPIIVQHQQHFERSIILPIVHFRTLIALGF